LEGLLIEGVLGAGVGLVLGLTGAGGAILSVPLLSFFLDLTVAQAAPIGLLAVFLSAGVGAILGLRAQILRYKAALLIAVSGLILSPIGIWLAQQLPNWPLVIIFVLILLWVARNMWQQAQKEILGIEPALGPPSVRSRYWQVNLDGAMCSCFITLRHVCRFLFWFIGRRGWFYYCPGAEPLYRFTDEVDCGYIFRGSDSRIWWRRTFFQYLWCDGLGDSHAICFGLDDGFTHRPPNRLAPARTTTQKSICYPRDRHCSFDAESTRSITLICTK